jgi:anti-anti-sigma factor
LRYSKFQPAPRNVEARDQKREHNRLPRIKRCLPLPQEGKTKAVAPIHCGSIERVNPAPFEVKVGNLDHGVRTISVRGELDLSTAPELEGPLEQTLDGGEGSVLIDLSSCEFIDSTGIALIVRAWQRLDSGEDGHSLVICSQNDQVRRVLEITGLELSIPVHTTRDEALAAMAG